jgi:hypothetical protein
MLMLFAELKIVEGAVDAQRHDVVPPASQLLLLQRTDHTARI